MTLWRVTMTFDRDPLEEKAALELEESLDDFDGVVANIPEVGVSVTLYEEGQPLEAASRARSRVESKLGAPVAFTIEDDGWYQR